MKRKKTFNIGEVSRLFNVSADSIRYYEKIGILEPTRNQENNYRVYTLSDIRLYTSPTIKSFAYSGRLSTPSILPDSLEL